MKIPLADGPQVQSRPVGTPFSSVNANVESVAPSFAAVGQATDQAIEHYKKAKAEADATLVTGLIAQKQARTTSRLHGDSSSPEYRDGFLSSRGIDAARQSVELQKKLQEDSTEFESKLDGDQLKLFRLHSNALDRATKQQIENHVEHQRRVAAEDTAKGRADEAVRAVGADPMSEELAKVSLYSAEASQRALASSPEDGEARVRALRGRMVDARVGALLSRGDFGAAELLLEQGKNDIDPNAAEVFKKRIADLRKDQEGETYAAKAAHDATDGATGRIDPDKAREMIELLPNGPAKDEARGRLEHRIAQDNKVWDRRVDDYMNSALSTYHEKGTLSAVDPAVKTWLRTYAALEWQKLVRIEQQDAESRRITQRDLRERIPPETPTQAAALVELRAEMAGNPDKYRDPDYTPQKLMREWGPRLHISGLRQAGSLFAELKKEKPGTGAEFTKFVEDEVRGNELLAGKAHKKAADQWRAIMGDQRRAFLEKNKREPNLEEVRAMREAAWTTPGPSGLQKFLGIEPKPVLKQRGEVEPPAPADIKTGKRKVTNPKSPNFGKTAIYEVLPNGSWGRFIEWEK